MPDSTGVSNIFLPELQFAFRNYWRENADLPLENYIKVPEIEYNAFHIKPNNIFELLFNNNYGNNISGPNPDITGYMDSSSVYENYYTITEDNS